MSGKRSRYLLAVSFALVSIACAQRQGPKVARTVFKVDFCQPRVARLFREGLANFQLAFLFDVDEAGNPVNVKQVESLEGAVEESLDVTCIPRWNLPNMSREVSVSAVFTWEHGVGWKSLLLVGGTQSYVLTLSGDTCPYCNSEQ